MNNSVGDNNTDAGAVAFGGHNNAASAQFTVGAVGFGPTWGAEDLMAQSIVRISRELEEAQAQIAVYEVERSILLTRIKVLEDKR